MKSIGYYLDDLESGTVDRPSESHVYAGIDETGRKRLEDAGHPVYTGKVRDVVSAGDELLIVHSDRLSAFDKLIGMVPYKGTILTAISDFWLQEAQQVVPTHFIGRPHERILKVERADPFKVEVIVRGYLAGSMMRAYHKGERDFCGSKLREGLKAHGPLPEPIITPTTKAEAFEHDENTTPTELISKGICNGDEWRQISEMALKLFAHGQKVYLEHGWILVDTKYEFGRTKDGQIKVIDEIHTPDSSRLWVKDTYEARTKAGQAPEMLDKEIVRRYLLDQGFSGEGQIPPVPVDRLVSLARVYLKVAETLTGAPLKTEGPDQNIDVAAMLA